MYLLPLELVQLLEVKHKIMNIILQQLSQILCTSPLVTIRPMFGSHVFIVIGALVLDGDLSLLLEVEAKHYNCYKVDMGTLPHEAPIPCVFEVLSTSFQMSSN
jgi:hypothetical protein